MKKIHYLSILILGWPLALMCFLSLILIRLGIVEPDPKLWNFLTVYIVDFFYGLALIIFLIGFMFSKKYSYYLAFVLGGYSFFSFGQSFLESILNFLKIQEANITNIFFIMFFMLAGFIFSLLVLTYAFFYKKHWESKV